MYGILIEEPAGRLVEIAVLSVTAGECMRVAPKGSADVVELRRVDGQWIGERGHAVTFALLAAFGSAQRSLGTMAAHSGRSGS